MRRWLLWFLLAPQAFVVADLVRAHLWLPLDAAVVLCLFLALFAERAALPWLLLGAAMGRALIDEASLWVQILVLGVPVAALLPLRRWFYVHRWLWQSATAAGVALLVPRLAGLCGRVLGQPSAFAVVDWQSVLAAAVFTPPSLWLLRALPPFAPFTHDETGDA